MRIIDHKQHLNNANNYIFKKKKTETERDIKVETLIEIRAL